jgi:hypothetical protein
MEKNTKIQKKPNSKIKKITLINQDYFKKIRLKIEVIVLIILILIGGYLIYKRITEKPEQPISQEPKCEILYEDCRNISCRYYDMCNTTDFEACVIYDCGSVIKAVITDKNGQNITREKEKTDMIETYNIVQACRGTTKIINNECVKDKRELKVQVETQGNCPIDSFMVNQGQKNYVPQFEKKDDYFYLILENCNQILKLVAIGTNGALIE